MAALPVQVLLAGVAVSGAVPLLWWSLRGPGEGLTPERLTELRTAAPRRSLALRGLTWANGKLAACGRRLTPVGMLQRLEQRLVLAGRPAAWPLERVLAVKALLSGGGLAVGLPLFAPDAGRLPLALSLALAGYLAPDLVLSRRASLRRATIQRELPDTLDQVSICVEAGLGFEAALAQAAAGGTGPLAEELVRTLQELQMGAARRAAFRAMAERTGVVDLRRLAHAIVQAETYGVPIADVLHAQAAEQRVRRRQRAEERAMKMPVKVVFPLVLCILPTLFIVLIGPGAIRIGQTILAGN